MKPVVFMLVRNAFDAEWITRKSSSLASWGLTQIRNLMSKFPLYVFIVRILTKIINHLLFENLDNESSNLEVVQKRKAKARIKPIAP